MAVAFASMVRSLWDHPRYERNVLLLRIVKGSIATIRIGKVYSSQVNGSVVTCGVAIAGWAPLKLPPTHWMELPGGKLGILDDWD